MTVPTTSDAESRARRLLGVGLRADLVSRSDIARDISFATTARGLDLELVEGAQNLCQCLAIGLTVLRGSDVFDASFGFLGLTAVTEASSPALVREGLRGAIAEFVTADPRVRRIVDLRVDNPMASPSGARRRQLDVRVDFETAGGSVASVATGGLRALGPTPQEETR